MEYRKKSDGTIVPTFNKLKDDISKKNIGKYL